MVIEGDSSFTTPGTTLSCIPSSVNLEGGSSYVQLDDYIEWNPPRVIPRVSPMMFACTVTQTLFETIVEVGSALRGTRELMLKSGVSVKHPRVWEKCVQPE